MAAIPNVDARLTPRQAPAPALFAERNEERTWSEDAGSEGMRTGSTQAEMNDEEDSVDRGMDAEMVEKIRKEMDSFCRREQEQDAQEGAAPAQPEELDEGQIAERVLQRPGLVGIIKSKY